MFTKIFTSKDDEELRLCLTIAPDEDKEVDYEILDKKKRRYFSTLMAVLSILDRDDICVIYQLVMNIYQDETPEENKYPLKKEVLSQLIELKLETEEDSTMALELIRFVKKQIAELEPKDSDGDEKDP
ncbi:hypothetical protein Tco_1234789 [Tanacetum coccineum]